MNTPTDVKWRSQGAELESEQDAYVWVLERILDEMPDLLTGGPGTSWCIGKRGGVYFTKTPPPGPQVWRLLSNGLHANLTISMKQRVSMLDRLAQYVSAKRGTHWKWTARYREAEQFIDTACALDDLDRF